MADEEDSASLSPSSSSAGVSDIGSVVGVPKIRRRQSVAVHKMEVLSLANSSAKDELMQTDRFMKKAKGVVEHEHVKKDKKARPSSLATMIIEEGDEEDEDDEDDDAASSHGGPERATRETACRRQSMCQAIQQELLTNSIQQLQQQMGPVSGFVTDYLVRMKTSSFRPQFKVNIDTMLGPRELACMVNASFGSELGVGSGYMDCVDLISQEKLLHEMKQDITVFWKNVGDPAWMKTAHKILLERAKEIVQHKRQAVCLRDEVSNWLLRKKLLSDGKKKEKLHYEQPEARYDRLQEFWTHVHMDERKTDNLLKAVPESPSGGLLSKVSAASLRGKGLDLAETSQGTGLKELVSLPENDSRPGTAASAAAASTLRAALCSQGSPTACSRPGSRSSGPRTSLTPCSAPRTTPATPSLPELLRTTSRGSQAFAMPGQRPDSTCWKTRAARSHCSFGKTGDWRAELPESIAQLSPSSPPASSRAAPTGRSAGTRDWAYWEDEVEELNRRTVNQARPRKEQFVGKWWSKGLDLAGFVQPKHIEKSIEMPKSSSLPSLRTGSLHASSRSMDGEFSDTSSFLAVDRPWESKSAFTEPWKTNDPRLKSINAPAKLYLRACQSNRVTPKPVPFATGHSPKLECAEKGLLDTDLFSMTKVARDVPMEDVDLQGNMMLTEKGLLPFIDALCGAPLQSLNLRRVVHAGQAVLEALVLLIGDPNSFTGVTKLQFLDLSGIQISPKWHLPLCNAIMDHPSLRRVELADTNLGNSPQAKECLGAIMKNTNLKTLNLGWNSFTDCDMEHLGACLVEAKTLECLNLSNCASTLKPGAFSPVLYFAESLVKDQQLTRLDLSLNRIEYRGALIIEDALMNHKRLTDLDVSENPLGKLGMRSIMRLLAGDQSALTSFRVIGCGAGYSPPPDDRHPIFTATNPGGRYNLCLEDPYMRALLRMLYKTCERFDLTHDQAFKSISGHHYAHPTKDEYGVWAIPEKGKISLTFTIERAVEGALKNVKEEDFEHFLNSHNDIMRLCPGFKKVLPMLAQWKKLSGSKREQMIFIDALAKDFHLTYPQVRNLCQAKEVANEIVWQLLPCVVGNASSIFLTTMLTPTLGGFCRLIKNAKALLQFNVENPTGHYRLDLENPASYNVAEGIMLLDRWEAGVALKNDLVDTSQRGNRSHVRNEMFRGAPLDLPSVAEWTLPNFDVLELDYCSTKRAPHDAHSLDKVTLSNMMVVMQQTEVASNMLSEALRVISHTVYLNCVQVRELIGLFKEKEERREIFVIFFNRIVDMWNEKVFRVRFEDPEEFLTLCDRVGYCTFLPYIQPEQVRLTLDFKYHDQRLACNCFVMLANKERRENVIELTMTNKDGTIDPLPWGLPKLWENIEKMPTSGVFRASYKCAPEDRKFAIRKSLFETYGYWHLPVQENEVMWWADINQTSTDILEFLTFVYRRFKDAERAFKYIDGEEGNGVISLREFEAGVNKMKFKKFKGPNQKERLTALFRYLDPSGEGGVSVDEFNVLDMLWNEVLQSIREFVQFIERTIGDDLGEAWDFFDEDGSGEVDREEWKDACLSVGYFGPVMPIFHWLDEDGEGSISGEEFGQLGRFLTTWDETDA